MPFDGSTRLLRSGALRSIQTNFQPVEQTPEAKPVVKFVVGSRSYSVGERTFEMDAAPFIENGRTFVPVRFLAYAIGVPENGVSWDGAGQTVRLENRGVAVTLRVRERVLRRNGSPVQMDVASVLRQNRVFLPARFVAEAFGCSVAWDGATKAVYVYVYPVRIDWEAAKNGTLQPPENAKQPPDKWGFEPKAVKAEFKVGSRYATVTRTDGSTHQLDLGAPCVVVSDEEGISDIKKFNSCYSDANCIYETGVVMVDCEPRV